MKKFTCDCCELTFGKKRSDKLAELEYSDIFPEENKSEAATVCDQCFKKIMQYHDQQ